LKKRKRKKANVLYIYIKDESVLSGYSQDPYADSQDPYADLEL